MMTGTELKAALDSLYRRYDDRRFVDPDPLVFLYRYSETADREIAGLVASSLAFGGVRQIMTSVGSVLDRMGGSPAGFVRENDRKRMASVFGDFRHRWATGVELASMLAGAGSVLEEHGTIENAFISSAQDGDADILAAITGLAEMIRDRAPGDVGCLIPSPQRGSACKRLNLYLRWMVRSDGIDPGGWDSVSTSGLIVPLDIHMQRFALLLGLTRRSQGDMKAAREITAALRKFDPEDPVRYDFSITRLGIRRDEDRDELLSRLGLECCGGRIGRFAGAGRPAGGRDIESRVR